MSVVGIAETLDCFEAKLCEGTVDNALGAMTDCRPEQVSDEIYKSYEDADCMMTRRHT